MLSRRKFVTGSIAVSSGTIILSSTVSGITTRPRFESNQDVATNRGPSQLDPMMVKKFVGNSHGNIKGVKELIAKEPMLVNASWDWVNGDWETGLGAASHVGNRDIANLLLDQGARIDTFAMTMLGQTQLVSAILTTYPKTHAVPGPHGIPLLNHAVFGRDKADDVFELLLEKGADVNQSSNAGQTPLMAAASVGRVNIVKRLLDHKADPNITDKKSRTALQIARERKRDKVVTVLEAVTKT